MAETVFCILSIVAVGLCFVAQHFVFKRPNPNAQLLIDAFEMLQTPNEPGNESGSGKKWSVLEDGGPTGRENKM